MEDYDELVGRIQAAADRARISLAGGSAGPGGYGRGACSRGGEVGDKGGGSSGSIVDFLCSVALQVERDHAAVASLDDFRREASERDSRMLVTMEHLSARLASAMSRMDAMAEVIAELSRSRRRPRSPALALIRRLCELLEHVEPHQPLFNLSGKLFGMPRASRAWLDRCLAIERSLDREISGLKILDVGSGLGYTSFYFANREAKVTGIDTNPLNIEASRLIGRLNGIPVRFELRGLDPGYFEGSEITEYDVILLLDGLRRTLVEAGLEGTKELFRRMLAKVGLIVVDVPSPEGAGGRDDEDQPLLEELMIMCSHRGIRWRKVAESNCPSTGIRCSMYAVSARSP
jgi:SAM-dependent methyltransferase